MVKELFLRIAILSKGLMEVQVILRKVGEHPAGKNQSFYTVQGDAVRTHLHEAVCHPLIHHAAQYLVQGKHIRSGVVCLLALLVYIYGYGGDQSHLVAQLSK